MRKKSQSNLLSIVSRNRVEFFCAVIGLVVSGLVLWAHIAPTTTSAQTKRVIPDVEVPKVWKQVVPTPPSRPFVTCFSKVTKQLQEYADDPLLAEAIKKLLSLLPEYQAEVETAFKDTVPFKIDVILQDHGSDAGINPSGMKPIYRSQARVYRLLEQNRYDVVSAEGFPWGDLLNVETAARLIVNELEKRGSPMTMAQAKQLTLDHLSEQGCLRFVHDHPEAVLVGGEYQPVNRVHHIIIEQLERSVVGSATGGLRYLSLNEEMSRLRSEIGVAMTIRKLRELGKTRGAVVIGYSHGKDLEEILSALQIASNVYNTVDGT